MSTYLKNKLLRRQSGGMDFPGRQHRSRSLDVEALQRSGVQALMIKAAAQHQQQLAAQCLDQFENAFLCPLTPKLLPNINNSWPPNVSTTLSFVLFDLDQFENAFLCPLTP
ncbi:hypothetical protein ZHAS_00002761 [Anopheles sinensis]|uniref:Uncharacterized protein n=1 Tax=Anopheles sinensis TaxID=74873 RepID=A0A084VCY6_ANOSI|nr:hypothetical protein ZHAS_00002761 [Anopheles sinensis]